jgi:hypothetical protein
MKKQLLIELAGWYGAIAIVTAYGLLSAHLLSPGSYAYQLLNLTGALGIIVISVAKKAVPPAVLNIFWALIALLALLHLW